jgi:hypothetical protein
LIESFTSESFEPLIGDDFTFAIGEHRLEVRLGEVTPLSDRAAGVRKPFSLVFLGPPAPVWAQQIYRVFHPSLGSFDLFLVPIGPEGEAMRYEAIFT